MSLEQSLGLALANPEAALAELDKADSEESLVGFMRLGWHVLEPSVDFVPGWAVECIAEHLEAVTRGEIRRLVINVPPGCTKSMLTNVFWPAWEWGPKGLAHHRYISASYEQGLATRDMGRMRELVLSDWFQGKWPITFKSDMNEKTLYGNTESGWRKSSSVGASLVGYRGDRIIIDDPHDVQKVESEAVRDNVLRWGSNTVPTRLNNLDESAIVVIMQRVHARDLSAQYLAEQIDGRYPWEHLCLPMEYEAPTKTYTCAPRTDREPEWVRRVQAEEEPLPQYVPAEEGEPGARLMTCHDRRDEEGELLWPERFSPQAVEELKATFRSWGGTYAEAGQLQQRPAPREGGMFKRKDFKFVDLADVPDLVKILRGWDLAGSTGKKSPYTVGCKWGVCAEGDYYLLDVRRERLEPHGMYQLLRTTAEADGDRCSHSVPQDPGQAGKDQIRHLAKLFAGYDVHFSPESGSKADRALPLAAQVEAGNVYLVRASWNDAFLAEAGLFPNSDFMDQIDASSRAFMRLIAKKVRSAGGAPRSRHRAR